MDELMVIRPNLHGGCYTTFDREQNALFIAFTSGGPGEEGGPDQPIFQGPNGETPYEYGWIMKITETPTAIKFHWEMLSSHAANLIPKGPRSW